MAKLLQRLQLDPELLRHLNACGYHKVRDVLESPSLQLMEVLDLPLQDCQGLVALIASQSSPSCQTVLRLHESRQKQVRYIPIGFQELDGILGGGIPCGTLTEIVGPAGIGKTQFCFMLTLAALTVALHNFGGVLYIDTERKFSSKRLVEIAQAQRPKSPLSAAERDSLLSRIHVIHVNTPEDLLQRLKDLDSMVVEYSLRSVIIDSIALIARADNANSVQDRQIMLGQQVSLLKRVAESFSIPVVVTNQVTGQGGGLSGDPFVTDVGETSSLGAALGIMFAHAVNIRLVLELTTSGRRLRIAKSPSAPAACFQYQIGPGGLESVSSEGEGRQTSGNVVAGNIQHANTYQPL